MKEIHKTLEKLKSGSCTRSIRDYLQTVDMIFCEEPSRVIYEMGNLELFELRPISVTTQCHSCPKHVPEGFKFCGCGICLRQDEDTMNRIKARFQALISPYYLARVNASHGDAQWQQDHWKAMDATRGARKQEEDYPSILSRSQNDEQHRTSQQAHG